MTDLEGLRTRIEAAALRSLGYSSPKWRMVAEAYAIRHDLRAMFKMASDIRAQYLQAQKLERSLYLGTQWQPVRADA